jgi:Cu+-exporting ATPase
MGHFLDGARSGCAGKCAETREEDIMEQDVVCGMQVDPAKAAGTSKYNGKTYYFCSKGCQAKFDANPGQYAK